MENISQEVGMAFLEALEGAGCKSLLVVLPEDGSNPENGRVIFTPQKGIILYDDGVGGFALMSPYELVGLTLAED